MSLSFTSPAPVGTAFAAALGIALFATFALAAPPARALSPERAVETLRSRLVKDNALETNPACLQFQVEQTTDRFVAIAVRERHDHRCGGDPKTAPVLDRFRVDRVTGRLSFLAVLEDEWEDYAGYKAYRDGAHAAGIR